MTAADWIMTIAVLVGPLAAVLITVWLADRSKVRDQRLVVLRLLIATRQTPSDPNWQTAINLIPVEFHGCESVISAHREFMNSTKRQFDGVNDATIVSDYTTKAIRLIYEVGKSLGYNIRESDLQSEWYSSVGWGQREAILIDSQKAMRDVATILRIQSRQLANAPLTLPERQLLGLGDPE